MSQMPAPDLIGLPASALDTAASWKRTVASSTVLSRHPKSAGGALSDSQNRAILGTALACSCLSFCIVLYALRIFIIKRRSFRHRLIMYLIMSNTLKAGLYFVFPIVVFASGPVHSLSDWCQASGFLLEFAVEAADMSILIIALHTITYILRPNSKVGEGGLYPYRNWIYLFWLGPPLLAASLAFIKGGHGYVTAGTFCYLPKRPYWYRLALSWVPRYLIIGVIIAMYIWLYAYVHLKFRGFENLDITGSSHSSSSDSKRKSSIRPDDIEKNLGGDGRQMPLSPLRLSSWKAANQDQSSQPVTPAEPLEPWDHMHFITTKPFQNITPDTVGEEEGPPPSAVRGSIWSGDTQTPSAEASVRATASDSSRAESRTTLGAPPAKYNNHEPGGSKPTVAANVVHDPLRQTRIAIRKELRYMFVYPAVYILMWSFPFAQHALYYNDYYVQHPIFWLNLVTSIALSLQAGVDGVIFSLTEKTREAEDRSLRDTVAGTWHRIKIFRRRGSLEDHPAPQALESVSSGQREPRRTPHWWEAEGRRRKDSVWLGTSTFSDTISPVISRTRSRSPDKPARVLGHSRTRSSAQAHPLFIPTLEPISTEAAEQVSSRGDSSSGQSPEKTTSTPGSSNVGRISSQSVRTDGLPHKGEQD